MASLISPRVLRRGFEIFVGISVLGLIGLLFYGNNLDTFLRTMTTLQWGWVLLGVALASMDWLGGGLRLWILNRHVHPGASLKGSILAGGMNSWGCHLTPSQTGGGPMMIYTLKRYGTPIPEAMVSSLMTFVATIVFFAIAGPLAIFLGAGRSLEQHGVLGQSITLYDLFRLSLGGFVGIGSLMLILFIFPGVAARIAQRIVSWLETRGNPELANRVHALRDGINRSHETLVEFFKGWGWLALVGAVFASALAFSNKLLAGYVVLRMLDIQVNFVDVLLLQTLITFLLYFSPTPGGAGLAEIISLAVMSIYVPRELAPSYVLLWRTVLAYLTVGFGSFVFWAWLRGAEDRPQMAEDGVAG
jgi:hypothetical protein